MLDMSSSNVQGQNKTTASVKTRSTRQVSVFYNKYQTALRAYRLKKYKDSIQQFESLLSTNTKHNLSDNAQYWIGESYYGLGDFQRAIASFEKVFTFSNSNKDDAAMTYMKRFGYCPGVGFIGNNVLYVENRNGNSDAQTLQQDTLERMFALFKDEGINIDRFRADGASYQSSTLSVIQSNVNRFYIRARMNQSLSEAIDQIDHWEKIFIGEEEAFRGATIFTPFQPTTKKRQQPPLPTYHEASYPKQ